jgi:hypothetical protein
VISKLASGLAVLALMIGAGVCFNPSNAWATAGKKVDCDKVVAEIHAGKKTKDIAKDFSISTSSVYRCKKKLGATAAKTPAKEVVTSNSTVSTAANPPAAK